MVAAACLVGLVLLERVGVWQAAPYVFVVVVLWVATLQSGLHASIAGMLSGLLVPALDPRRDHVEEAAQRFRDFRQSPMPGAQRRARRSLTRAISVNERLQEALHAPSSMVVVPIFALANAGVDLRGGVLGDALTSPVTWGIIVGLVVGKTVGILGGAWASVRFGWGRLPQGVGLGHTAAGGALSGIGFTVSLLIIALAFDSSRLQDQARVGVLLSAALASLVGWLAFRFAARFLGQRDAALPTVLDPPVDPRRDHIAGNVDSPLTLVEYPTTSARSARVSVAWPTTCSKHSRPRPDALRRAPPAADRAPPRRARRGRRRGRRPAGAVLGDAPAAVRAAGPPHPLRPRRPRGGARPRRGQFLSDLDDDELHQRVADDAGSAEAQGRGERRRSSSATGAARDAARRPHPDRGPGARTPRAAVSGGVLHRMGR